ncbi:MAG: DUF3365 domain-containing protein [Pseudomonadota bacterium]
MRRRLRPVVLLLLLAGCSNDAPRTTSANTEFATGAALLAPFKRDLKTALQRGLTDGPVAAVAACQLEAPTLAATHGNDTLRVGRTSHRLRSSANTAPDWVEPILRDYLADPQAAAPVTRTLDDGSEGYVEPIRMQPLCVVCHGAALAPDVAARIAELYPDDKATGFTVGDLRGVFWAEYPAAN